ncbi:hypothetical protein CBM2587_B10223 [Cupriavidus taiwanensis]|uniref:Uncharacterized protein n=1 Tax=Cupriavidus taiwanensis TaxID=164546 RepID=A0A375BXK0_9BURK|nr:hypothetical protein CBM2587_B10223 [Cupriavidus taiwanensis]
MTEWGLISGKAAVSADATPAKRCNEHIYGSRARCSAAGITHSLRDPAGLRIMESPYTYFYTEYLYTQADSLVEDLP